MVDIHDRKQAEAAVTASETRLRNVLQNMPVMLCVFDAENGQCLVWNKECERVTGYTAEEMVRKPNWDQALYTNDTYRKQMWQEYAERRGNYRNWEMMWKAADGMPRFILWSNISSEFPVPGWADWAMGIDITERREAQERSERIQAATTALSGALTPGEASKIIADEMCVMSGSNVVAVGLLNDDGAMLDIINTLNIQDEVVQGYPSLPLDDRFPISHTARTGKAIWIESNEEYQRLYPVATQLSEQSDAGEAVACMPMTVDGRTIGAIALGFQKARTFNDEDRNFLMTLAQQCAQAVQRARLYEAEQRARQQAEQRKERLDFLLEASTVLNASLDYETTLANLARLAVPRIADWCSVDILTEDETVQRLAVAHIDPEKVKWAYELSRRYPPDPDAPTGLYEILRTGKSELYPDIPDSMLVNNIKDPELLQLMRSVGLSSAMNVPLIARGRTLGVLGLFAAESGRHYNEEDLEFALELARRAAMAVDNAQLYREAMRSRSA
jgi:PAS domain S-box-containing protein